MNNSTVNCDEFLFIVSYLPYKILQFVQLTLATVGFLLLIRVKCKYMKLFIFHKNTKILLNTYLAMCWFQCCVTIFSTIHVLLIFFTRQEPCDLILENYTAFIVYQCVSYCLYGLQSSSAVVWIELWISSLCYRTYSRWNGGIGYGLAIIGLLAPFIPILAMIRSPAEIAPTYDYNSVQGSSANSIIVLYYSMFSYNVIGFFLLLGAWFYNRMNSKRKSYILARRFQLRTNILSVRLLFAVFFVNAVLIIFYTSGQLITRQWQKEIFGSNIQLFRTFRKLIMAPPYQVVLSPLIIRHFAILRKQENSQKIKGLTSIPHNGEQGAKGYNEYLEKQWA